MGIPVDSLARISTDPARGGQAFTGPNGQPLDPTAVTLTVQDPTGVKTTYSGGQVTHDSTGVYHVDVDTTGKAGTWSYEWKSTGTGQAAFFGTFVVDPSPLG